MQSGDGGLSTTYADLFDQVLASVAGWRPRRRRDLKLSACWPARGELFTPGRSVLVIGRATNGFKPDFAADEVHHVERRRELVVRARAEAERPDGGPPLNWVWARSSGRSIGTGSAFWRVTRGFVRLVEGESAAARDDWPSFIAWSNLAKIAPADRGNPSDRLYGGQYDACLAALQQEVQELNPGIVLVIAGEDWYGPVLRALGLELCPRQNPQQVRHIARQGSRVWLCTERPERRPEAPFVVELGAALAEARSG